ncbi:MAG: DUF3482 domain-containing protein [Verrucomicrobiales bacterium]
MPETIALSLISHTNVGKTTLARTLLRQDIGEVRDAQHVTQDAEKAVLLRSEEGDELHLWDTPGFGDTQRLVKRLEGRSHALGWFLSQVWDRFRQRALFLSQQALLHVQAEADVVCYLVNALENPENTPHVEDELRLLRWFKKPVLVLLNQSGPQGQALEQAWAKRLEGNGFAVLSLDAFFRCWIQEATLFEQIESFLDQAKSEAMQRLRRDWAQERDRELDACCRALGECMATVASDRVWLSEPKDLQNWLPSLSSASENKRGMKELAQRWEDALDQLMKILLAQHHLEGESPKAVIQDLNQAVMQSKKMNVGLSGAVGGLFSGAATGLMADIAAGGLTFGGGAVLGALFGALGGAGLAQGVNHFTQRGRPCLRWESEFLLSTWENCLLRYLAVAHYGRGRGRFTGAEVVATWQRSLEVQLNPMRERVKRELRDASPNSRTQLVSFFTQQARTILLAVLQDLHGVELATEKPRGAFAPGKILN